MNSAPCGTPRCVPANTRRSLVLRHVLAAAVLCSAAVVHGQAARPTAAPADLKFHGWDVISIKPNKTGSGSTHVSTDDTSFVAQNVSLKMLLNNAYGIREGLITGLPAWANNSRWDVNAKLIDPDPALKDRKQSHQQSEEEYRTQNLSILTDRFHIKAHTETRPGPVFDMVVTKLGPGLKKAEPAEEGHSGSQWHNTTLTAKALTLADFGHMMEGEAGRNIVDKTNLLGAYDYELKWSRDDQTTNATDAGATDKPPTLFTAMEEQLGLKLVPSKGTVTTLVVDSIDMPTED